MSGSSSSAQIDPFRPNSPSGIIQHRNPLPNSQDDIHLNCFLLNYLQSTNLQHQDTNIFHTENFKNHCLHDASILVSVNEDLAQSVGLLSSNIPRFSVPLLHHINIKIQVSKRQTSDGMVYYKVEAVAIGEHENNSLVRPEYLVTMESRVVAGWRHSVMDETFVSMDWDTILTVLRKASKIRYDSFGEQRTDEEASRVESEMGLFENEGVVVEVLSIAEWESIFE
jgi:hypothetical protein